MEFTLTDALWNSVVSHLKTLFIDESERNKIDRYFPLFNSHEVVGSKIVIGVSEQIQVDMFTPQYAQPLLTAFHNLGFNQIDAVEFEVRRSSPTTGVPSPELLRCGPADIKKRQPSDRQPVANQRKNAVFSMPLHEEYTFENFVSGPSNSFAHAAATAVAKGPGRTSYNPLFIYGGTGLGKTHLMEAIGHYVLEHSPDLSVCFITAETFLNEYVNALMNKTTAAFRERFRKIDLLLIDDVQFIADKEKIQEEFFNTFNNLMLYRKQIVLTSDVAPKDLKGCEERLTGRFQQGMVVEIEQPSYELRLAILKSKAHATHRIIPDDILNFIAKNITSHVRAIEGALRRIVTFIELNPSMPLNLEIVQHLLKDSIEKEKTIKDLTVDEIIKSVAVFYGVKIEDIRSKERTQTLVTPRQVAMFLSRKLTTKSLPEIATSFKKTHATVHHGLQTIQKRLDVEADLRKSVDEIASSLGRSLSEI
ncbi:MAG: chromosomal replication initiator protein DnaA [Kiritimatiellia bacterium]